MFWIILDRNIMTVTLAESIDFIHKRNTGWSNEI